jgi:3-hydroxy-3-methylglutaryl CoA synthase
MMDATSLGVEAARQAMRGTTVVPQALYFATSDPAYLDKTNATAIHAALDLPTSAFAVDIVGSVRSAVGAMRAARDARGPALAVLSDIRTGLPGGGDERDGGDGAAAFLFADDAPEARMLAEPLGGASAAGFSTAGGCPASVVTRVEEPSASTPRAAGEGR